MLLNINNAHAANAFNEDVYPISKSIRESDEILDYKVVFEKQLLERISLKRQEEINTPYSLSRFKDIRRWDLDLRDLRYLFARIEVFLNNAINDEDIVCGGAFENYVAGSYSKKYHVEHILAFNEYNISLFENQEVFHDARNRMGGLLFLKGNENISSGKEQFPEKLKTYIKSKLIWNMSLSEDYYHTNPKFKVFIHNSKLCFKPTNEFNNEILAQRTELLFLLIKEIWQ